MAIGGRTVTPSPEARRLFSKMVANADHNLHLNLTQTISVAAERTRAGHSDADEINQLEREEWIEQASDGGWLLH